MSPATYDQRFGIPSPLPSPPREDVGMQLPHELMIVAVERVLRAEGMTKALYKNRRNSLQTVWEGLWRRARAEGSVRYATSGAQLTIACGGRPDPTRGMSNTVRRQLDLLQAAGLCEVREERDASGRSRRTIVRLLALSPAFVEELKSEAGWAKLSRSSHKATPIRRRVVRVHETPAERHAARLKPWRRRLGRGVAHRLLLSERPQFGQPLLGTSQDRAKARSLGRAQREGETREGASPGSGRGGHAPGSVAKASGAGRSGRRRGDERPGVPEYRPLVRMLEQGFMARLADVPGIELEPLRDTRRLEYALARLDRYLPQPAGGAADVGSGPAAAMAMRIIDAVARDVRHGGSAFHPTAQPWHGPPPRHLGVIWQELHRAGFAARRARRERDAKNAAGGPPSGPPAASVAGTGASRC